MTVLTSHEGFLLLTLFGLAMLGVVLLRGQPEKQVDGFLLADRQVGVWPGAFSIAVSWVWAPAIFICSLQAYQHGLAGVFWFTAPNILCFLLFAPFALSIRKQMPAGYTLPEYIWQRFAGRKDTHILFLCLFMGYQTGAIVINAVAGGALLHALSGIPMRLTIMGMGLISLLYSLVRGLKASVFTDTLQMGLLLLVTLILVPWSFMQTGGAPTLQAGLAGVSGDYGWLLHPGIAFAMGIPITLSLLSGPFVDQMFFQRALAIQRRHVVQSFIVAGLVFALIPIALSLLGFMGAGLERQGALVISDPQMVGPEVMAAYLPKGALMAFCLMAFAGLCSTMDSSFCALSALGSIDLYKRYVNPQASAQQQLTFARYFMIAIAVVGILIALTQPKLMWVFLIYGAIASAAVFPVMFAIASKTINANAVSLAIGLSLLFGLPLSVYANIQENTALIVLAACLSVGIGLAICAGLVAFGWLNARSAVFGGLPKPK